MNGLERKAMLGVVFGGLYFDRDGVLANATIYPPFDSFITLKPEIWSTNLQKMPLIVK
jgi:hypothetical protein